MTSAPALGGASCELPRGASSLLAIAHAADAAHDAVTTAPATRWDAAERLVGVEESVKDRTRHCAFIFRAETFDNGCFAVSPAEAGAMDPQQRVLLEGGYAALHASSLDKATLNGSGTGVAHLRDRVCAAARWQPARA